MERKCKAVLQLCPGLPGTDTLPAQTSLVVSVLACHLMRLTADLVRIAGAAHIRLLTTSNIYHDMMKPRVINFEVDFEMLLLYVSVESWIIWFDLGLVYSVESYLRALECSPMKCTE